MSQVGMMPTIPTAVAADDSAQIKAKANDPATPARTSVPAISKGFIPSFLSMVLGQLDNAPEDSAFGRSCPSDITCPTRSPP